jgi:hypothetical protein
MSDCFICVRNQALKLGGSGSIRARANIISNAKTSLIVESKINTKKLQQQSPLNLKIGVLSKLLGQAKLSQNLRFSDHVDSKIIAFTKLNGVVRSTISFGAKLNNTYTDKFAGELEELSSIKDFSCVQKLYPISDEITSLNNSYFVNKNLSSGNLYDSIDEGLFTGNYNEHLNKSNRISDDNASFIQPSSIFTSGTFRYKCEVTRPYHHPKNSFLFIRAAAPTSNYGANIAPEYRIHNIKFEDPSGNIIVKYKDIALKGDADYSSDVVNYATYISEPEINNANLHSWDDNYPILSETSGYTLNMDFDIICLDDPFDQGFNLGYEERACELKFVNTGNNDYLSLDGSPLSTHTQGYHLNPTNTIRISAIEICNSGDLCASCSVSGIKLDNYFNFYTEIPSVGRRLSKTIYPVDMLLYNDNVNIYPEEYSLWESSPDYDLNVVYNTSVSGSRTLVSRLRNTSNLEYIKLNQNTITADSGRLTLKFSIEEPQEFSALRFGAFDFSSSPEFDRAINTGVKPVDNFFTIDSIELKVVAKKASGSRNYSFDVVGYSDDKILNVTPKVGAFLQNKFDPSYLVDENENFIGSELDDLIVDTNQTGQVPTTSGFRGVDDLGLSSESLSDKSAYYEDYLTSVDAGDHYLLSSLPVVDSEEFVEYTIPLSIYEDRVDIGKSIDYSMSSYFENLYVDLYPIPSGASISSVRLVVNYKPSNGMMLHTLGTPNNKKLAQRDITLLPIGWSGIALNSVIQNGPLSIISDIPQSYGEPQTLKTNYARRWRGVDGNIVNGPYDPNQFGFSFYNPQADHPFLNGYFDFNNTSGNWIISNDYSVSGYYNGNSDILKNIGWRFNNTQLFNNNKDYTTIDWTQSADSLYGRISDSFDCAISISGNQNIKFNNVTFASGFAIYLRFTPNYNNPFGSNSNLFNIYSNESDNNILECGYNSDNKIRVIIKKANNTFTEIVDNKFFYEYSYPLSLLVTHNSGILSLYTKNELDNSVDLKDSENLALSDEFSDSSLLNFGYDEDLSLTNTNMLVHEIGISTSGNLVDTNPNRLLKQTTATSFLDGHSHAFHETSYEKFRLHDYVNEDTSSWKLGDFKICAFSPDFDGFTTRIGKDYIVHHLKHHGSGYAQITNLPLPSSINASGLAYHTQIENDFLRFNLQDMPDVNPEFYSTLPRICKTLPRDYDFAERAFVVDTIIEHETNNNILWPDGSIGPKLIVSLYSKNQDPVDRPSKVNWGLINRSIHYLPPSGCYEKISSTFNHNDLIDISEPWALFDLEHSRSEFDQKYYSTDIDEMFLQYDLVYPSGSPFESTIKIHSANVRLEDALAYWADSSGQMNLYASGEAIRYSNLEMFTSGLDDVFSSGLLLYTSGSPWNAINESIGLCVSGIYGSPNNNFNLFVKNSGELSILGPDLYILAGSPRDEQLMSLVMADNSLDQLRFDSINLFVRNNEPALIDSVLSLNVGNVYAVRNNNVIENMNLVTFNNQIITYNFDNSVNLYLQSDVAPQIFNNSLNLFTTNYLSYNQAFGQKAFISWNQNNVGKSIDPIVDSGVPFLNANDEIRGVDLTCFGSCDNVDKCFEQPIIIHDIEWYADKDCVDGGIFRPENTYTNLATSGFKTDIGYSGHFYGIRKYDGLVPNAPYNIKVTTKTGDNQSIYLPNQYMELDYGSNNNVNYSGVKFAADKNLYPDERQAGNKYGKSVAVKNDLIAIGAPMQTLQYVEDSQEFTLEEAGAVFLYRRQPRPSGYSWLENEHKSEWLLETKLTLPSGLLKDYPTIVQSNNINGVSLPLPITERYWNVGQEGRQFGHSLDLGINTNLKSFEEDKKEILIVGGPSAKWTRDFEDLSTSGVSIGLIVFTDEFRPSFPDPSDRNKSLSYINVLRAIQNKDLIFRYFSDPPIKFDVKLIICEPVSDITNTVAIDFPEPRPSFIVKQTISRQQGIITSENKEEKALPVFSGIKSAFDKAFPYDASKLNNNIPSMLGIYVDNSRSLGRQAVSAGLDKFLDYYKTYSFASGLRDFYNTPSSGAVYEYDSFGTNSEDWVSLSITALDSLLDTGRLVIDDQVRFLTSGIGIEAFNENLNEFNYPPSSGGRVYIFEKESGAWNLIQEIQSPIVSYDTLDRFGHAVAISEDTNILAVGSPYINDCCKIYQHRPLEKERLFNGLYTWINYQNSLLGGTNQRYEQLIDDYENWTEEYGFDYANKILYSKLTASEKFYARDYLNIEEYENIFTYTYDNIPYTGTWGFVPQTFAPTSRLGYSVAVNDDGSTVAFGAPTDSFNAFDDYDVYYKNDGYLDPLNIDAINGTITPSWRSNVNAGAVRLFESREYYPHTKVVEFGKFGNLEQALSDNSNSGEFNYLASIFADKIFTKMTQDEVNIPDDAGLAFIITPGEDALSDEILNNIISWLSLGDRNLVLVGNDPIWEASGVYNNSNQIINKILAGLNSKMRLYPAKNQYDSLPSGYSKVIPSFRPTNGTKTYVLPFDLSTAYGVADIRMHLPGYAKFMPCTDDSINQKCELPLVHMGDLRAEWKESCVRADCGSVSIQYPVNWPFVFKTFTPQCCEVELETINENRFDMENQDPIPLLAAAENTTVTKVIPAIPAVFRDEPIFEQKTYFTRTNIYEFDNVNSFTTPAFALSSGIYNNVTSYESNISNVVGNTWFEPASTQNTSGILQAQAFSTEDIILSTEKISDLSPFCVEQSVRGSLIIALASLESESQNALLNSGFNDQNINFYSNLVAKDVSGGSRIAQLGGWTGRSSFTNAYSQSILQEIFQNTGNEIELNVFTLSQLYDVCWIANPVNLPSESEFRDLVSWLNLGNKKLIITRDNSINQITLVDNLLRLLETDIQSLYLQTKDQFAKTDSFALSINQNHPISQGFNRYPISSFNSNISYTPFSPQANVVNIAYTSSPIYDDKLITDGYFKIDSGIDKITFPAIAGSGYKIFIETLSESPSENQPINIYIKNGVLQPKTPYPDNSLVFSTNIDNFNLVGIGASRSISNSIINRSQTTEINIQVQESANTIELYLNSFVPRINFNNTIPKTSKLIGISGVLLPILSSVSRTGRTYSEVIGFNRIKISEAIPEQYITETVNRPISSLNDRYCVKDCNNTALKNKFIADGPVVMAQEVESVSSFNAGVARSRITVIADSSLVQGKYMADEFGRLSPETVAMIRSLYPETTFPLNNSGRQYNVITKLVAPERGSPQKYYALKNNMGSVSRFYSIGSPRPLSSFSDKESRYDPKYVVRSELPWLDNYPEQLKEILRNEELTKFETEQINFYGAAPKFSGIIDGTWYSDIGIKGGIPQIMKDKGIDYLDFDVFTSGYPGDLFGFALSLHKNKLVVGSPFTAFSDEDINSWLYYVGNQGSSGVQLSYNGGAGAAYIFEKTFNGSGVRNTKTPWEFIQKLRPENINAGQDISDSGISQSYNNLGPNPYTSGYLLNYTKITDQFGYDVSIDSDIIAVGAPGHDFGKNIIDIYDSGQFIRKAFTEEFDIPLRNIIDLGNSGVRNTIASGYAVLNNGAIFTFENKIVDLPNRKQKWTEIEKAIPQGINARQQSLNENDFFGRSVYVHKSNRSDSDYVLIGASENHNYSSSGDNLISKAGAAYSNDIMLRGSAPVLPNPNAYIDVKVFGERSLQNEPTVRLITQNLTNNAFFSSSGIIYTNTDGAIFMEVSGQDPSPRGFIQHRPFVASVDGLYYYGAENTENIPLFVDGNIEKSQNMDLYIAATTGNVYNILELYVNSIKDFGSGVLSFYTDCPDPIEIFESGLPLHVSGIGISTDRLNMRVRGY